MLLARKISKVINQGIHGSKFSVHNRLNFFIVALFDIFHQVTPSDILVSLWASNYIVMWDMTTSKPLTAISLQAHFTHYKPYRNQHVVRMQYSQNGRFLLVSLDHVALGEASDVKGSSVKQDVVVDDTILIHDFQEGEV